ncbi:glycosyltransferase family 4 protein [Geodermatophilus sp. SYSU D00804]
MERFLSKEAVENPAWSGTLQHHELDAAWAQRLDEEIQRASFLLVASTFSASTYVAEGVDPERIVVVPLGAEFPSEQPLKIPRAGGVRYLFAGQLTQRKGLSHLVDAFAEAQLPPGSVLQLAGAPVGDAAELCARVPGVELLGLLSPPALDEVYRSADVFVLPSLVEGFGLVGLEAMARGLPTIVSSHTFAEDVIEPGEDGYVFPVGDVATLRRLMEQLGASTDARARMGRAGAEKASRFTWDHYGRRLMHELRARQLI